MSAHVPYDFCGDKAAEWLMKMKVKMKKFTAMVICLALTGAVLTGCAESQPDTNHQNILQNTSQETVVEATEITEETVAEVTEESVQTPEKYEDNFAVDAQAAKEFAEKVKDAVSKKDLEALAELTAFPVYVGLPDVNGVETKEDFLKLGAEAVFTEELIKSVELADIDNFQPSMAGFPISDGGTAGIIFSVTDGVLAISGINY